MTNNIEYLKLLPIIEVSFQDHFCGCICEITTTPKSILGELRDRGIQPKIWDKILLWEKDVDDNNQDYYLCNIGEVMELNESEIRKYLPLDSANPEIPWSEFYYTDNKPSIIKIDRDAYFDLPLDSEIFSHGLPKLTS